MASFGFDFCTLPLCRIPIPLVNGNTFINYVQIFCLNSKNRKKQNMKKLLLFVSLIGLYFENVHAQSDLSTIKIGNYSITTSNFSGTKFRNGDDIPFAKNEQEWVALCNDMRPAYCFYDFKENDSKGFGCFYNWFAVNDFRNIAPIGFHVTSSNDLDSILRILKQNGDTVGISIKTSSGWGDNSNNSIGLSIIPSQNSISSIKFNSSPSIVEKMRWTSNSQDGPSAHFWTTYGRIERRRALGWHVYDRQKGDPFHMGEWSDCADAYSVRLIKD